VRRARAPIGRAAVPSRPGCSPVASRGAKHEAITEPAVGGDTATTDTAGDGTATTGGAAAGTGGGSATTARPTGEVPASVEEWEALWEAERAAVLEAIEAGDYGKSADGTMVTGPDGFTMDLSNCPASWSDTEGLTDTEIKIGHTTAQSGALADYGNISRALQVQFDEVNAAGGIEDSTGRSRTITFIVKDDGYDPTRTIPLVDELIDSEKVFMMWTLGSPNSLKTYDKLNERCIPQPVMSGHPAWGDPVEHPWTIGSQLAYNTEAVLWGSFIEDRIDEMAPDGGSVTVAGLVMNNDFGKSYDGAFKDFLAQSPLKDRITYVSETIEPQAPTITDAMTTLTANDPNVFIAMTAGTSCTQAIVESAQNGLQNSADYLFQPSVCSASSFVAQDKVGGDAADGWWIINGGVKDINSPAFEGDPMIELALTDLGAAGIDPKSSGSFGTGYGYGWPIVQGLKIASQMEGGLTRSGFIVALRTMDMTHPYLLDGIKFNMSGNADSYFIEGGVFQTRDAANEVWVNQGDVIDLSGKSKNCVWDQAAGVCT
jgi:branched-chain amino acid transport system substrate-binding protein